MKVQHSPLEVTAVEYLAVGDGDDVGRPMTRQCVEWLVHAAQKYPGATVKVEDGGVFAVTLPSGRTTRYSPVGPAPIHERHAALRRHLSLVPDCTTQEGTS